MTWSPLPALPSGLIVPIITLETLKLKVARRRLAPTNTTSLNPQISSECGERRLRLYSADMPECDNTGLNRIQLTGFFTSSVRFPVLFQEI
jgi:hypothetical protein